MTDLGDDVNEKQTCIGLQDMDNRRQDTKSGGQTYSNSFNSNSYCSGFVTLSWILTGMFMHYYIGGTDEKIMGGILCAGGLVISLISGYSL